MGHSHAVGAAQDEPQVDGLQPGAKLLRGQYEILRYLSNGGFGITYLARDSLERDVVIKECYPGALCQRNGDLVEPANPDHQEDLRAIIDLFIQEARNHARLVHPNIVDVHQVFEDNNTAYIAMDLIRGCDLLDYVENPKNDAGPDFIVQVTEKMLSAVSFIHQSGMLHRDISPDNILIDENNDPVLIDFGAAREQAAQQSAALLTLRVIKDGYSPHEFYVRGADQGPSSDLYVLAATLYHAISGERPIDGQTRLNAFNSGKPDPYRGLTGRYQGYPKGFLEAIDRAMEVHATDRLQSALDWLRMFRGPGVKFETFAYRPISVIAGMDRKDEEAEKERIKAESENAEAVVTALLAGNADLVLGNEEKPDDKLAEFAPKENEPVAVDTVVKSGSGGSGRMIAGVALVLAAVAAGGFFVMTNETSATDVTPAQAPAESEETAAAADEPAALIEDPKPAEEPTEDTTPVQAEVEPVEQTINAETEPELVAPALEPETQAAQDQPIEQVIESDTAPVEVAVADQASPAETVAIDAVSEDAPIASTEFAAEPETSPAPVEPVNLVENQMAYGHWDVDIPFTLSKRRVSTGSVYTITAVDPGTDLSMIGDWVQRGATIFTLNGEPVRADIEFVAQAMEKFSVDPDGYIRAAVRYRARGETRAQNGLLALPAHRMFGLQNGITFEVRNAGEDGWQTVVSSVPQGSAGDLRPGDVVLSETQTGLSIDAPESLDGVLTQLVTENLPNAEMSVLRDGTETAAVMQLAQE